MRVTTMAILVSGLVLLPACGRRHRVDVVHHEGGGGGHSHAGDGAGHAHDGGGGGGGGGGDHSQGNHGRERGDERGPEFVAPQERAAERRDDVRDARAEDRTGWNKLGECSVDGKGGDKDKIHVGARDGTFTRMMLVVEHSALEMFDVEVQFGDGSKWSPETRLVFGQNTRSRVIDLPGAARLIKKVEFRYSNLPRGGRAQVELWAR